MKRFFFIIILILLVSRVAQAGIKESLNPTKLWEFRDSLVSLSKSPAYHDMATSLLGEIQRINQYLSRVQDIIPTAKIRIDVVEMRCPPSAYELDRLTKNLQSQEYHRIGYIDCTSLRSVRMYLEDHPEAKAIVVIDSVLQAFILSNADIPDPRLQRTIRLARMVQCEFALVTMGFSLRERRLSDPDPNKWLRGIIIIDHYFEKDHLKNILRIVEAETNLK